MANSTDSLIEIVTNLDPDQVLTLQDISLPGDPANEVEFPIETSIPPSNFPNLLLVEKACHVKPYEINDISSLKSVFSCLYSVDTELIAVCGGQFLEILNSELKTIQTYKIQSENEESRCVTWGLPRSGVCAAMGSYLGFIYLISADQGRVQGVLEGHMKTVNCLKFLPIDSEMLLSASDDLSLRLWNTTQLRQLAIFTDHIQGVLSLDIHKTQKIFISSGRDSAVKFWRLSSYHDLIKSSRFDDKNSPGIKADIKPIYSEHKLHRGYIDCVMFVNDLVVSKASSGEIVIWKCNGHDKIVVVNVIAVMCAGEISVRFALSPKMKMIAIGGLRGECYLYSIGWEDNPPIVASNEDSAGVIRSLVLIDDQLITANTKGEIKYFEIIKK